MPTDAGDDNAWYELLRCPVSLQILTAASGEILAELEQRRLAGALRSASGQSLDCELVGALLREDRQGCYPIRDGLPALIADELILISGPELGRTHETIL